MKIELSEFEFDSILYNLQHIKEKLNSVDYQSEDYRLSCAFINGVCTATVETLIEDLKNIKNEKLSNS